MTMEFGAKKVDENQRIPNSYKRYASVGQQSKGISHAATAERMPKLQQIDLDVVKQFTTNQERSVRGGNGRNFVLNLLGDTNDEPSSHNNQQPKLSPIESRIAEATSIVRGSLDQALTSAIGNPTSVGDKAKRSQAIFNQSHEFTPSNRLSQQMTNNQTFANQFKPQKIEPSKFKNKQIFPSRSNLDFIKAKSRLMNHDLNSSQSSMDISMPFNITEQYSNRLNPSKSTTSYLREDI